MSSKNFLGQKELGPKNFCLKKEVGLTLGGGYMTPSPPPFFGKKNYRVNPGGSKDDDPPKKI